MKSGKPLKRVKNTGDNSYSIIETFKDKDGQDTADVNYYDEIMKIESG